MFITTACVAGAAAFFSVYGLAHTFPAAHWSVVFMGGSLEAGKLMTASYLYRFSDSISRVTRWLGFVFVFCLMMLTSLGIYGYLAEAYQSGSTDMKQVNASMVLKKEEQVTLQKRKSDIDGQIAQVAIKDVRGKQRLMTQFGPEVSTINKRLIALTAELQQEAQKQISTDSHVGPIIFVARIIGIEPDNAISLLILLIIFSFDPLAIFLTIATNNAVRLYQNKRKPKTIAIESLEITSPPVSLLQPVAVVTEPVPEVLVPIVEPEPVRELISEWEPVVLEEIIGPVTEPVVEIVPEPELSSIEVKPISLANENLDDLDMLPDEAPLWAEEPVIEQINEIYTESATKAEEEKTPVDKETVDMVERFYARQQLIKNVRNGSLN